MPVVLSDSDSDIEFIPAPSSSSKKASGSAGAASSSRANAAASSSSAQSPRKKAALPSSTAKGKKAAADLDEDMVARIRNEIKSDAPKRQEKSDKQKAAQAAWVKRQKEGPPPGSAPAAPGSKEIPEGEANCLAGLKFVFTGELSSLSREEATELAKRYGGTVTGAPSGVTSFVVVGANAGASKLRRIAEKNVPTIDEDGFLDLIRTRGSGKLDDKQRKKLKEEEAKIKRVAAEMEEAEREADRKRQKLERQAEKERQAREQEALAAQASGSGRSKSKPVVQARPAAPTKAPPPASSQLWTTKYAPTSLSQICGNKTTIEKLMDWLGNWDANRKTGFKRPGKYAIGSHKAVLISGPPGIGKTTTAHLVAKECGYEPLELNASDARSKKLIETGTNIDNQSVDGWMKGTGATTTTGMAITHKTCLILDEVDGMSGGDRGGVGAMNALIKKTRIPMILICNDKGSPKMKPFQSTCAMLGFRKPTPAEIRSRIMSICFKEKVSVKANVIDQLIQGANSDIRQVLNMLSTWKLSKNEMDFDEGKELAAANEKNSIATPFTLVDKLFGPYTFSHTSRMTLGQKMEIYFQDFSFMPLFVQENYLKHSFARLAGLDGRERTLKELQLMSQAADSISEGDVMDRMIHGPDQQWSLLPNHAIMSAVRPAYFCYGSGAYGQGAYGPSFPAWMGQNSKMNKNNRQLNDIQIHMRLRTSANQAQIRQHYIPALAAHIIDPLTTSGASAVDDVIDFMDGYFLNKEDWDSMVELGVGSRRDEDILKMISSATKATFTRNYNKKDHPIAVHKAVAINFKKVTPGPKADQEDVQEEDEIVLESESEDDGKDPNDLSKDKLIKNKAKPKGKAAAAPKAKVVKAAAKKVKG